MKRNNKLLILEKIKELELQKTSEKKNVKGLNNVIQNKNVKRNNDCKNEKVKDYRKQVEYGEKKFIKP